MNTTPTTPTSITDKRRDFHRLHQAGCFALPNPWDIGSARMLQGMGFAALATTSAGFAWSVGHPDNGISRDMRDRKLKRLFSHPWSRQARNSAALIWPSESAATR